MTAMTNYIGVDIAKDTLQVQIEDCSQNLSYDAAGLRKLLKIARLHPGATIVCEATGGYERKLLGTLFKNAVPVALVNPARVRAFARSEGIKAKTDRLDAQILVRFAREKRLSPTRAPDPVTKKLAGLLDRRSQLEGELAREKNRLQKCPTCVNGSVRKMIRLISREIQSLEKRIGQLIDSSEPISRQSAIMQTVTGVGPITAWSILGYLSEISSTGRNQVVALAGLAPYNRDSGKTRGKRSIQAGRAKVRRCLYMAARSAAVHNPVIKAYVEGLKERGKPDKVAMVAAMRKLLIHLQSLLKSEQFAIAK